MCILKTVQVLLSSYNGEKYLNQQIDSILNQVGVNVKLLVRDDGSKDSTIEILKEYKDIEVIRGNNQGVIGSFLTLIELSSDADYYAFADQDDVWDADKFEIAIKKLEEYPNIPAIYSGNTRLVDGELNFVKNETLDPKTSLGSAIVKNYVTGCTTVFNKILMENLKKYRPQNIPGHDWWVNLVCLALGGVSIYDVKPHMSYRQHGNNVVGGNATFWKKWMFRLKKFNKPYHRNNMAKQILDNYDIKGINKEILQSIAVGNANRMRSNVFTTGNKVDDILFNLCLWTNKL